MEVVLEVKGLKEFIDIDILKPTTFDAKDLAEWKKYVAKGRRIILERVRDHIFSNICGKLALYAMWKALTNLFQNSSDHKKLVLL